MSHKVKYRKVSVNSDTNTDIDTAVDDIKQQTLKYKDDNKQKQLQEIKSCGDFCKWVMINPMSKLPFFYLFLSILIPFALGIYYFIDNDTSFIIAGICGLIINIYSLNHFRSLLNLKHEIDNIHQLNKLFAKENKMLNVDVDRLLAANDNLKDMHSKLLNINIKRKENLQKFRNYEENLKIANLDSIEGISNVRVNTQKMVTRWKQQLLTKERRILCRVFDRFEQKDKSDGMTRDKFKDFSKNLPTTYQKRFDRLGTFKKLAAGKSYIALRDFESCLDIFAEMDIEDVDMDFEIERKQQEESEYIMSEFLSSRGVSITKRSKPGVKFTADDIKYDDKHLSDDFNSDND